MLKKPTREETYGCLFGLLGSLVGLIIAGNFALAETERLQAEKPDTPLCGLPFIAASGIGAFLGLLFGALIGMILSRLLPGHK